MRASSRYVYQTRFVLGRLQPLEACSCDRLFSYIYIYIHISGSCDQLGVILKALPCWGDRLPNNSLLHRQVIYPSACFSIPLKVHLTSNPAQLICKITFFFYLWFLLPSFVSAHGASSKPVQSSSMWSGLIVYLKSSVTVKRRRVHLKTHGDCFLGSEAVDVVAEHIKSVKGLEGVCVCLCMKVFFILIIHIPYILSNASVQFFLSLIVNWQFLLSACLKKPKKVPLCHGTRLCVCARLCWTVMCSRQWGPKFLAKTGSRMCFRTAGVHFTGYSYTNLLTVKYKSPLFCDCPRCFHVSSCLLFAFSFVACRFVRTCTPSVDELERGALANGIPKLFGIAPSDR